MSAHQIDSCMEAIIYSASRALKQPWMRILFSYPGACFITGEQAIRNLRSACDAALGEGK